MNRVASNIPDTKITEGGELVKSSQIPTNQKSGWETLAPGNSPFSLQTGAL